MESNKEKINPEENQPNVKIDDLALEEAQQDQVKGGGNHVTGGGSWPPPPVW